MLHNKVVLITGGTGSFGKAFTRTLLTLKNPPKAIRIYSRDELKQWEMAHELREYKNFSRLRFFIGDVRDKDRLARACDNVDVLIHAAALKQILAAEYNPTECIQTNIIGAENVISAAIGCGVNKIIALSTDKAVEPINLYGASKLCADKLFIAANNITGKKNVKFSVVRYGNVMGSRGSVIPLFLERRKSGTLSVTHKDMTRFNITLDKASAFVLHAIEHMHGGEIFVPKAPSYKILDLAEAIGPNCKVQFTGIRDGEKIHEELISRLESYYTYEFSNHFILFPNNEFNNNYLKIAKMHKHRVKDGFYYNSQENTQWLKVEAIRTLIKKNIDRSFTPL